MIPSYSNDDIDTLRQRMQEFEIIFLEYLQLENLIERAGQGYDLQQYAREKLVSTLFVSHPDRYGIDVVNLLLYVDPVTLHIVDANKMAIDFLGYTRAELEHLSITDLETIREGTEASTRTYVENAVEEHIYQALYRHKSGQQQLVHVSKRHITKNNRPTFIYRLEDKSLHRRLWYELIRREQYGFAFQKEFQVMMKVVIELGRIKELDELCFHIVKSAIEQLGFDRIGIWFLDPVRERMVGMYGVDEDGHIRPEHGQSWSYEDTYIAEFLAGRTDIVFAYDGSPIYNEKSQIIGYGWHMSAPMLHNNTVIGVLTVDNFRHKHPMSNSHKELLRLYAISVGELIGFLRAPH